MGFGWTMVFPSFLITRSPPTAQIQNHRTDDDAGLGSILSRMDPIGKRLWQSDAPTKKAVRRSFTRPRERAAAIGFAASAEFSDVKG